MPRALAHALLVAGLALAAAPAPAQFSGTPGPAVQADSHIFSALTTRTDPRVLADKVALGPALRAQLGAENDSRAIYDALLASIAGRPLRSRSLSVAEAAGYASLGVNSVDPLVLVEAGDVRLLLQYSSAEKNVAFVEQLTGATLAAPTPPQAPKAEPIVEKALPVDPPPPPVGPAPPVAAPSAAAPASAPQPRAPAVAAVPAAKPDRPRGECVIKPVMSEDELWNCSAPGQASLPQSGTPAPMVTIAPPPADRPQAECVIKPVMTEEDLRACATVSRSRPSAPAEPSAPAVAAATSAPALQAPPQPVECVIKPVMTEEDLRLCAAASRSRPAAPMETAAPALAASRSTPALQAPPQPAECLIKPVMTEEDLRLCAAASRSRPVMPAEAAAVPVSAQPAAPAVAPTPRDCVIKPVMSEEDLRACGSKR